MSEATEKDGNGVLYIYFAGCYPIESDYLGFDYASESMFWMITVFMEQRVRIGKLEIYPGE